MIIINTPKAETVEAITYLRCDVEDTVLGGKHSLWFSSEKRWGSYFTDEVCDAFLLVVLQVAMREGQDIQCEAPVSSWLLYNLVNSVIPILHRIYPNDKQIKITAEAKDIEFGGTSVGTGCSLGVDSFSTIIDGMSSKFAKEDRLTHLSLFNSGQHGDSKLDEAESQFFRDLSNLEEPAKALGLPVVGINSNINQFYKDFRYPLLQRFVFSTCAFPLAMQKLFKAYIFASSYPIEDFYLSQEDISHVEYAVVPLLSTKSTTMRNSNPTYSRVDKTRILSNNAVAQNHLNVCWSHQLYAMYGTEAFLRNKKRLNCGICDKCLRTLFTLELLGKLDEFNNIFDIPAYMSYRTKFIVKVLCGHKTDIFYKEIYALMQETCFKVPATARLLAFGVKIGAYKLAQKLFGMTVMPTDK